MGRAGTARIAAQRDRFGPDPLTPCDRHAARPGTAAARLPNLGADPAAHQARVAAEPIPVQSGLAATAAFVAAQIRAFLGEV